MGVRVDQAGNECRTVAVLGERIGWAWNGVVGAYGGDPPAFVNQECAVRDRLGVDGNDPRRCEPQDQLPPPLGRNGEWIGQNSFGSVPLV